MTTAVELLKRRRAAARKRPSVDLSATIVSPLISQGPRPTCVAFALSSAHEGERAVDTFRPAVEPIWWHLHALGKASPDGVTLQDAADALRDCGQCEDRLWPYNDGLGFGTEQPPVGVQPPPWTVAGLRIWRTANDGVEDPIEDSLAEGHPVVIVVEVTDEFRKPQPDGYVQVPAITVPTRGYHAVVVVGAWTDPTHGRVFLIRNSWGDWWAAGGHCLMPVEYLVAHCGVAARVEV